MNYQAAWEHLKQRMAFMKAEGAVNRTIADKLLIEMQRMEKQHLARPIRSPDPLSYSRFNADPPPPVPKPELN